MQAIAALLAAYRAEIGLHILFFMFVEFVRERYPATGVAVLGACVYAALGVFGGSVALLGWLQSHWVGGGPAAVPDVEA